MISGLGMLISRSIGRLVPDPFVIALALTILTAILSLVFGFEGLSRSEAVDKLLDQWWSPGLWAFLKFSMQMCLILVTGYALADSHMVRRAINGLSNLPGSTGGAAVLISLCAMLTGLLNWGLGLIVGALLARRVGESLEQRGIPAHYPLLCAAGYTGLLVWHGGLSGSAPIKMTKADEVADIMPQELLQKMEIPVIPLQETLLSNLNIITNLGLLLLVPVALLLLAPRRTDKVSPIPASVTSQPVEDDQDENPGGTSQLVAAAISLLVGAALICGMIVYLAEVGFGRIGPNEIIATMLGLGMILHVSPHSYLRSIEKAARGCAGIILQFPFYAGIMAMMAGSGLLAMISGFASSQTSATTLPLFTFLSAGLVNLFVPSGGGQWGIQGPIAMEAAAHLNSQIEAAAAASGTAVDPDELVQNSRMVMAVAYGDELTNMLQPFWALPLLAITGIKARDMVGYTAMIMVLAGLWMAACLAWF
ncbi:MAG: hypothetical protein CMJ32_12185 [Phycisphaerae bacterium]|nr:hypothetical protein [Phycisphaerae bacterium]